ncbi:hypothetical protein [Georgenia alba]|uniref:PH domain-containing protein n=1 Tax=Georgenia alba TaxID=2233858 RepID=A0ABW2Q7C5_9MICO
MTVPPSPPPEYVVHTDRVAVRRTHGAILWVHGILAAVLVALILGAAAFADANDMGTGWLMMLPFLVLLCGQIFQLSIHSYVYGGRIAIDEPMTLTAQGITVRTNEGPLSAPWEAVTGARIIKNTRLRIMLHPDAVAQRTVRTVLPPRAVRHYVKHGIGVARKGIQEELTDVAAAIHHLSGGRVQVTTA